MAYSLTSLVDKVRQTLTGSVAQSPTTFSNLGNRVVGGYNKVAEALPFVPTTGEVKAFGQNPLRFMADPSYNKGNNFSTSAPMKMVSQFQGAIEQGAKAPGYLPSYFPKAIVSAGQSLKTYMNPAQTPVLFSKQGLANYGGAVTKTLSPVMDVALLPKTPISVLFGSSILGGGISSVLGAGKKAVSGESVGNAVAGLGKDFIQGAQQGVLQAPKINAIGSFTNPTISKYAGQILSKFPNLSKSGTNIINRILQGTMSVPEGYVMAKATGNDYNLTSAAIDFAVGSGLAQKTGGSAQNGIKRVSELLPPETRAQALERKLGFAGVRTKPNEGDHILNLIETNMEQINNEKVNKNFVNDTGEILNIFDKLVRGKETPSDLQTAKDILKRSGVDITPPKQPSIMGSGGYLKIGKTPKTPQVELITQEAKKYKSAEEFVKAQGNYHGSRDKNLSGFVSDASKIKGSSENELARLGVWTTDNEAVAKNFAEYSGAFTANGLFSEKPKYIAGQGEIYSLPAKPKNPMVIEQKNKAEIESLRAKLKTLIPGFDSEYGQLLTKLEKLKEGSDPMEILRNMSREAGGTKQLREKLLSEGYDAVIINGTEYDAPRGVNKINQTVFLKPEEVKPYTKSQLTDIWNQAHGISQKTALDEPVTTKPTVDPLESLKQEARKYKSAEEFVKNEGITVYRASPSPFPDDKWAKGQYFAPTEQQAIYYSESHLQPGQQPQDIKMVKVVLPKTLLQKTNGGNSFVLKEEFPVKSQLTDIWNKANKADGALPTSGDVGAVSTSQPKTAPQEPTKVEVAPWDEGVAPPKTIEVSKPSQIQTEVSKIKKQLNQPKRETSSKRPFSSISPELYNDVALVSKSTGSVKNKVNLLDYLRTPDRVLEKIGLKKASDEIKTAYNAYLDELPIKIGKVTEWFERVKQDPTASQRLFRHLDGDTTVKLNENEMGVAKEMRSYLDQWAERLNLPVENRLANYITHIFEPDFIQKEFDPDLAKIIQNKVASSVYDPFLQQRLGKLGYKEDVFAALDAYTKRAVRKANMDPALEKLSLSSDRLDVDSWNYVKSFTDRVNLRPTQVDNLLDNLVKQSPVGYRLGQRPVTAVSRAIRQAVYRGTLGLNVGSALRNLTQGVNTYAKLGEKFTGIGYVQAIKNIIRGDDELQRVGVLRDNMIQDRQLSAVKDVMEKLDSGLFSLFNFVEKINRGSAYYGGKARALAEGLTEAQAVQKGVDLARNTQFTFGSVDTPVALQSDLVKTFTQFQSFNLKQTEFLHEMIKNKEYAGLLRFVGANLAIMATFGQLIGMDVEDMIPFSGVLTGKSRVGETPPVKATIDMAGAITNAPDKYGNLSKDSMPVRMGKVLIKTAPAFLPGGVQIKKTIEGLKAVNDAGSYSRTGKLQYPIPQDVGTGIRAGLFGKSNLDQGQWYFDNNINVLGDKQTQGYKEAQDKMKFYRDIMEKREQNRRGGTEVEPALGLVKKTKVTKVSDLQPISEPTYTGKEELDKRLTSEYNAKIAKQGRDIMSLYDAGTITANVAGRLLDNLKLKKQSLAKSKKPGALKMKAGRRISIKVARAPKIRTLKIKSFSPKAIKKKPLRLGKMRVRLS